MILKPLPSQQEVLGGHGLAISQPLGKDDSSSETQWSDIEGGESPSATMLWKIRILDL